MQLNWTKVGQWLRLRWLPIALWLLVGLPTLAFFAVSAVFLAYTYWPVGYGELVTPKIPDSSRHAVIIAHGVGDTTATWSEPLRQTLLDRNAKAGTGAQTRIIALDWHHWADSFMRCSVDGLRIGRQLGQHLAASSNITSVHAIGHSCGSFVVLGLCRGLREANAAIQIQSTYLDPVSIYGGVFWNYGVRHFGECADFSEAYIDSEDGVPGSNHPLANTYSFDVTAARIHSASKLPPHVWPTQYYQLLIGSGHYPDLRFQKNLPQTLPRGGFEQAEDVP